MSGHCTSVLLFEVSTFSNERSLWRSSVCNNNHDNHDYHDYHDYRDNQDSQICELFQLSAHFRRLQFVALRSPIKTRLENQISFCFCLNIFKNVKYWNISILLLFVWVLYFEGWCMYLTELFFTMKPLRTQFTLLCPPPGSQFIIGRMKKYILYAITLWNLMNIIC